MRPRDGAEKLMRVNGLHYSPEETLATNGGKHALFSAFHALFQSGDDKTAWGLHWNRPPKRGERG